MGLFVVISHARSAGTIPGNLPVYRVIDLGTLGGDASGATSLSKNGQVVGWSQTGSGVRHAFLYSNGMMTDLGALPGGTESVATGINDHGRIVGYSGINEYGPQFPEINQAFIWETGLMKSLGALHCPCSFNTRYGTSSAQDINNTGIVASGWSETVRGSWVYHAFLWDSVNGLQDIGGGAGDWSISRAFALNDNGFIVGDFARDAGMMTVFNRTAVRWDGDVMEELGNLPGHSSSTARDINNRSQIVGWSWADTGSDSELTHAVMWTSNGIRDLGMLPGDTASRAQAINNAGHVAGWSGMPDQTVSRAFLWVDGLMIDLNRLLLTTDRWMLTEAIAINDAGQITGTGLHEGQPRAFLLKPVVSGTGVIKSVLK